MVSRWGDNWAEHFPMAEFAFNSSVCSSTGFSPFEVAYGRRPAFPGDLRGERSDVPRAETAATRVIALATACRDQFESTQMSNQESVNRRQDGPIRVGDLVLLSAKDLVDLRTKTACPRLSSRFVGPFRVVAPPASEPESLGRAWNYVWVALPISLGKIQQPLSLSRLRRYVERSPHLGGSGPPDPVLDVAAEWGQHCGRHIDKVSSRDLAEICIGHKLELRLPADCYPPDHHQSPFTGPRPVWVYDTFQEGNRPLQLCVYLLDRPIPKNEDKHEFETCTLPILAPAHLPASQNWTFMRALKFSFPGLTYLKGILPNASSSVVFRNTLLPVHQVVADCLTGGRNPTRELLVQSAKDAYENSAWVKEKFVPKRYLDEFWQRVEPEVTPAPAHD